MSEVLLLTPGVAYERPDGTVGVVANQSPLDENEQEQRPEDPPFWFSYVAKGDYLREYTLNPLARSTEYLETVVKILQPLTDEQMIAHFDPVVPFELKEVLVAELHESQRRGPRAIPLSRLPNLRMVN